MVFSSRWFFQKTNERIRFFCLTVLWTNSLVRFFGRIRGYQKVLSKLTDLYKLHFHDFVFDQKQSYLFKKFEKIQDSQVVSELMGGSGQKGMTKGLFIFSKHLKVDVENHWKSFKLSRQSKKINFWIHIWAF